MHPNTTEKRTATDIVSQQHKASETGEANRVLINKNRCPQQDSSSTPAASRARRSLGPAPSPAAAQHGAYPVTPGLSGYARAIERYQRYSAIPGLSGYARAIQAYPYRRSCACFADTLARRCALVSFAALSRTDRTNAAARDTRTALAPLRQDARRSDPARAASDPASLRC